MAQSSFELMVWAVFFGACLLLDALDISLPRGDSVSVAGALLACALVLQGMGFAMIVGIASLAISTLLRAPGKRHNISLQAVARVLSLVAGQLVILSLVRVDALNSRWLVLLVVPSVVLGIEFVLLQYRQASRTGRPVSRSLIGGFSRQAAVLAAEVSAAALAILTFDDLGLWSLLPVTALLLLIRQSYALLLEIRETFMTTIGVLVEAAESQSADSRGHAERTAEIARRIGSGCGLSSRDLEKVSYAAMIHGLDRMDDEKRSTTTHGGSAEFVTGIDFFAPVMPVVAVVDATAEPGATTDRDALCGFVVALASDADAFSGGCPDSSGSPSIAARCAHLVPGTMKARAVSSALQLGYRIPSIG